MGDGPGASSGDAAATTRRRIASAARAEFAQHGVAGARVDRIARRARTSKERVYAYFDGKSGLYQHVLSEVLGSVSSATRLDPADLPGYAGRLFDHYIAHPDDLALVRWSELEASSAGVSPVGAEVFAEKADLIRDAQARGFVDTRWHPLDVLLLVNQIAVAWPMHRRLVEILPGAGDEFLEDRRRSVVTAVATLFPRPVD